MGKYASKGICGLSLGILGVGGLSNIVVERDLKGRICDVREGFYPPLNPFNNCSFVPCSIPLKEESKSDRKEKYEQWKENWNKRRGSE